jgi:pimeloyl-ACP methyl ester carboxylesterase
VTLRNLLVVLSVLCAAIARAPATEPDSGVVYVAGGITGLDPLAACAHWVMPEHEFHDFEWTHGKGRPLRDLQDTRNLEARAAELADLIRDQRRREPNRPVYLIGHSAGTGLVLRTAELLPPQTVERIILLSPAVSAHYDLRPALTATRGEIVSFNSSYDRFILDFGTNLFGTVDRYYETAAGADGFRMPDGLGAADREQYKRLVQVPYRIERLLEFQGGLHNSTITPQFLAKQVRPWLAKQ